MDGLKPPSLAAAPPLRLLGGLEKYPGLGGCGAESDGDESLDDDASLDSLASLHSFEGEARGAGVPSFVDDASTDGELGSNDGQRIIDAEAVLAFLKTHHPAAQNQPLADLQRRYQSLQYQLDPRAHVKSVKGWFRDRSFNEERGFDGGGGLWWTSEVMVPRDVARAWGLAGEGGCVISGDGAGLGAAALDDSSPAASDADAAAEALECLRAVCGECTKIPRENSSDGRSGGRMHFRTKAGARKAAALGLLWRLEVGGEDGAVGYAYASEGGQRDLVGSEMVGETGEVPERNPDERFAFLHATFHGAMEDKDGPVLSRRNPCKLQCLLSVYDGASPQSELIEVKSSWYQSKDAAVDGAFAVLQRELSRRGASAANIRSVLREKAKVKRNKPAISFEAAVPLWASAELEGNPYLYLYELEFHVKEPSGERIPVAKTMGLDATVATRVGVLLGEDLFEGRSDIEKELEAAFRMHSRPATVKLVNRTKVNASEINRQAMDAARKAKLPADIDAVSLARWFNWVVLRTSKQYGKGPIPRWEDLVAQADIGSPCGGGRTYLFLPLQNNHGRTMKLLKWISTRSSGRVDVDWRTVLETVNDVSTPAVEDCEVDDGWLWSVEFWISVGLILVAFVAVTPAAVHVLEMCSDSFQHSRSEVHSCQRRECSSVYELVGFIVGAMSDVERWTLVFASAMNVLLLAKALIPANNKVLSRALLQNRFLRQQIGFGKRLFVAKREGECVTSSSLLIPRNILSDVFEELKATFSKTNNGLWLEDATYAQYFETILQRPLRRLSHELVSAELVGKYTGHDLTQPEQPPAVPSMSGYDLKSISNILAKRGLLVLELVSMLPLPRDMLYLCQHQSSFMPRLERQHLLTLAAVRLKAMRKEASDSLGDEPVELSTSDLVHLVDSATTATASDNVGVGASPAKTEERLESLGDSVLLFFLVRNLFVKSAAWDAECVLDEFEEAVTSQGKNEVLFQAGLQIGLHQVSSIAGKKISDVFEALLGAAYLADRKCHIVIGLLNEVGSQFPRLEGEPEEPSSEWYAGVDTWLNRGAPWPELEQISGIDDSVLSVLKSNATKLWQRVLRSSSSASVGMPRADTTVVSSMECALFDDSLEGGSSNNEALECLAKLRDKLFHFGHASLQLKVVEEIYDRFPTATSGDMHLMKAAVLTHDVLAYVFVKNGFHEFLFDTESEAVPRMKQFVERADALGTRRWEKQGGWILPGLQEFRRRLQFLGMGCESVAPRYAGLAVGRLCGQEQKLPEEATEELAFSFRCIVGALALSRGVHEAWRLMKPFFAELLLVSPDELRATYADAPLVRLYAKGKS